MRLLVETGTWIVPCVSDGLDEMAYVEKMEHSLCGLFYELHRVVRCKIWSQNIFLRVVFILGRVAESLDFLFQIDCDQTSQDWTCWSDQHSMRLMTW